MADVKYASPKKPRRPAKSAAGVPTLTPPDPAPAPTADTLRDRLAAIALSASEVSTTDDDGRYWFTPKQIAKRCYAVADAMLREREGGDTLDVYEAALRDDCVRAVGAARALSTIVLAGIGQQAKQYPDWGKQMMSLRSAVADGPTAAVSKPRRARGA